MERGTVKSYDKDAGVGMISRVSEVDVKFFADSIIGRDRMSLKPGDSVWFEVSNTQAQHIAMHIRIAY